MGRDKSMEKICSRFYWDGMTSDIREYVKRCDTCQCCNDAKFVKANAALHPIAVKPKYGNRCGRSKLMSDSL